MKKNLVILTIDFPDPLLEKELDYHAAAFGHVYILPSTVKPFDTVLPTNVTVHHLFTSADLSQWGKLIFRYFFSILRIYTWTIFQRDNWYHYIKHHRSFLGHLLLEIVKVKPLADFIREKNLQEAIFYDYWLVDGTIAFAELRRRKIIHHAFSRCHGFDLYDERQFENRVPFRDYRVRHLDAVFTISAHGYNYLKQKLSAQTFKKVKLSYLGIQSSASFKLLTRMDANWFTIVSCANLIKLKRIDLLVEVLRQTKLNIRWIHFGDGVERQSIEQNCKALPANVIAEMRGATSNEKVLQFYEQHAVDLFISLSETEGLPVSMMEAISFGIPILACSINGVPEIVTEVSGKRIPVTASKEEIVFALEDALLNNARYDRLAIRNFFLQRFEASVNYNSFISVIGELYDFDMIQPGASVPYQQCTRCVLDSSDDPAITFDSQGVCSYCHRYEENEQLFVKRGKEGETELKRIVKLIQGSGEGKPYDCILGISGGVDSTYLAYKAKELGLRPLAVHFDNGWNSELATKNIEKLVSKLGLDLHTLVVDWEEFKDLQLAFLKASVIDIELPTDHAMLATLYKLAIDNDINYILSGHNVVTESVLPLAWYFNKRDAVHIEAISKQFGTVPLNTFPLLTNALKFQVEWKRIKSIAPLNYLPYNKADVKNFITRELGWRDYGGKHYESIFTRFYQGYVLIKKFGVDKRKAHLSNLICSGQLTQAEALEELKKSPYDEKLLEIDYDFVLKKLGLSREEFEAIMSTPVRKHSDYPVEGSIYDRSGILRFFGPAWRMFKRLRERLMETNF